MSSEEIKLDAILREIKTTNNFLFKILEILEREAKRK